MKLATTLKWAALVVVFTGCIGGSAARVRAVTLFWNTNGTAAAWNAANWGSSAGGPFTTAWTNNSDVDFGANSSPTWVTNLQMGNVIVHDGFKVTLSPTGTLSTNGAVRTIDVGTGAILDLSSQGISTTAGTGFIKSGAGILFSSNGNAYAGGFTLNKGTVVIGNINAMGAGALNINGGTLAANGNRAITAVTGVTVGGNFTMGGVTTGVASGNGTSTATISLTAPVNLGAATRTITIGTNGQYTFSGIVSNGGLIIDAASGATGRIILTGQNTFAGGITVKTGATLSANGFSSTGVGPTSGPLGTGTLTIDGGSFIPTSSAINAIANPITLNNVATNAISVGGGPATLSGNITGAGGFSKGSSGILILSGANNYSGVTAVNSGTLAFAKTQSFYNGVPANWTDANFSVDSGANLVYAVGGAGEFSFAQFLQQATVGTVTGGFKDGSSIGIDTTNGGNQTISTVFTNNNAGANKLGLIKSGTNTLFLTAANTHSGPTTVAGGTLNLSNLLALQNSTLVTSTTGTVVFDQSAGGTSFTLGGLSGAGNLALQNNAGTPAPIALTVGNNNTDAAYTANLTGAAGSSLTKIGTGIQALSGTNSGFSGSVTVSAGTLAINSTTAIGTGPLTLNAGAKLDNTSGSAKILSTNNVQNWNGNFSFVGSTATSGVNLGTGAVTMAGSTVISLPGVSATNNALTIGGVISDSGNGYSITASGVGRLLLTGQNTFSGGVNVIGAVVHVGDQSSILGSGTGPLGTGTLALQGGQLIGSSGAAVNTIQNNITLTGSNLITTNGTFTLSGAIGGAGGFDKSGSGTVILSSANTYAGDTSVSTGALTLKNQFALQNSTYASASAGGAIAFDQSVAGNAFSLGGVSGNRNIALQNNAGSPAPVALSVGNNTSTYSGAFSGAGSLVKVGAGTTTLAGANTYTGTTFVNQGMLLINGSHTGGDYTVNTGGRLGGTGSIAANVNILGGTLAPGASIESLDITGAVAITSGAVDWEFSGGGGLASQNADVSGADLLSVNGAVSIASTASLVGANLGAAAIANGTKFTVISYASGTPGTFDSMPNNSVVIVGGQLWTIQYDDTAGANGGIYAHNVTLTAVPEASSILVMGLGGIFAIGAVWLGKRLGVVTV